MMYRCGWGSKEGQETVLAVEIIREGFDWALAHAELSHYERGVHPDRATWQRDLRRAPARVQWDPERDLHLNRLPYRSLQLGLAGEASRRYADEWTVAIRDVTPAAREIHELVRAGRTDAAAALLPEETAYPLPQGTPLPVAPATDQAALPTALMESPSTAACAAPASRSRVDTSQAAVVFPAPARPPISSTPG